MGSETQVPLIYIHLPKCAGTSMMTLLRANYGDGFYRVQNGGGWRKFHKSHLQWRASIRCLTGHMPWTIGQLIPGHKRYAVMMRNPIERVASLYWFCRSFQKHKYHKHALRMNLETFAASRAFSDIDNGMTRWMAGRGDVGSLKAKGRVTDEDLRFAMTHVSASSVGFVSTIGQSIRTWALEFGWANSSLEHKMRGNYPGPSAKERRIIAEYNRFDMALYEYALKAAQ